MEKEINKHLVLAKDAIKKGDLITATVELTETIKEDERCAEAYVLRAQLSMAFGDRDGAAKDFEKAVSVDPSLLESVSGEFKNREENPVFKVKGLKRK
mgnify:CR=1 FL=1